MVLPLVFYRKEKFDEKANSQSRGKLQRRKEGEKFPNQHQGGNTQITQIIVVNSIGNQKNQIIVANSMGPKNSNHTEVVNSMEPKKLKSYSSGE